MTNLLLWRRGSSSSVRRLLHCSKLACDTIVRLFRHGVLCVLCEMCVKCACACCCLFTGVFRRLSRSHPQGGASWDSLQRRAACGWREDASWPSSNVALTAQEHSVTADSRFVLAHFLILSLCIWTLFERGNFLIFWSIYLQPKWAVTLSLHGNNSFKKNFKFNFYIYLLPLIFVMFSTFNCLFEIVVMSLHLLLDFSKK